MKRILFAALFVAGLLAALSLAAHEHKPPHHGTLVRFGDEFAHLELVLDPAAGRLTAYALDGEAEKPVRLKASSIAILVKPRTPAGQPFTLNLMPVANPLTGEVKGYTSEFTASVSRLEGMADFDGKVKELRIRGSRFRNVAFNYPKGNE